MGFFRIVIMVSNFNYYLILVQISKNEYWIVYVSSIKNTTDVFWTRYLQIEEVGTNLDPIYSLIHIPQPQACGLCYETWGKTVKNIRHRNVSLGIEKKWVKILVKINKSLYIFYILFDHSNFIVIFIQGKLITKIIYSFFCIIIYRWFTFIFNFVA